MTAVGPGSVGGPDRPDRGSDLVADRGRSLTEPPGVAVDAGELHPRIDASRYATLQEARDASERAFDADLDAHDADAARKWAADQRVIDDLGRGMTADDARAIVRELEADDAPDNNDRYHEYAAAKRTLAAARGFDPAERQSAGVGTVLDDGAPRDGAQCTSRMVDARDQAAASGRFDEADATQRVIDAVRGGTRRQVHERESARQTTQARARQREQRGVER